MAHAFGYLWTALFAAIWIYLTVEVIRTTIRGRFWFWRRKANGRTWPPARSESPVRFWMLWLLMAGPFLLITALMIAGLTGAAVGAWR